MKLQVAGLIMGINASHTAYRSAGKMTVVHPVARIGAYVPTPIVGIPFAVKLGSASIGTFALAAGGWAIALLGQEPTGLNSGTIIPAAALTATAGALAYVVRLVASGALVHRDPAQSAQDLDAALTRTQDLVEAALERERILNQILLARIARAEEAPK